MSNNKDRSNGFDSLRQRIMDAEQNTVDKGWNVPSESVWNAIRRGLHPKNRSWLAFIPWFLFGGALLSVFILWNKNSGLQQELKSQLSNFQLLEDSLTYALRDCRESSEELRQSRFELADMKTSKARNDIYTGEGTGGGRTQDQGHHHSSPYLDHLYASIADRTFPSVLFSIEEFTGFKKESGARSPSSFYQNSIGKKEGKYKDIQLAFLTTKKISPFWVSRLINVQKSEPLLNGSPEHGDARLYDRWSLRLYAGYGLVSSQVKGIDVPTSEALGLSIENGDSYGFEGLIRRQINSRWAVSTGLNFQDVKARTGYQVDLAYDPNSEIKNANGNFHLDFEHSIPSSAGNISLNFGLLRLAEDQIQPGETLPFRFQSQQHFYSLGIPLWIHYSLLPEGNYSIELSTGYRLDYLAAQKSVIRNFEVGHAKLHNRYALMESSSDQYRAFSSRLLLGLEMGRTISNRLSLQARLRSSIDLDPVYRFGSTESRFINYDLSLGMSYNW